MVVFYALYLFWIGGTLYQTIELFWCGRTDSSMFFIGGTGLLIIDFICNLLFAGLPIYFKCLIGCIIITALELISGVILNLWLKKRIWDYSDFRFNFKGQICLLYSFYWAFLSLPAIAIAGYFRSLLL